MAEPPKRRAATGPSKTVEGGLDGIVESTEARELLAVLATLFAWQVKEQVRIDEERAAAAKAAEEAANTPKEDDKKDVFRKREDFVQECDLGVTSLVGSWFHKYSNGEIQWQGCVVAEPQPGAYLVECHNWVDGASAHQRVVTLKNICEAEEGYEWRFFDDAEWMKLAGSRAPAWEAERQIA